MTLSELNEPATFVGRNFGVNNFAKATEKATKIIIQDLGSKTTDKDGSIIGVIELEE